MKQVRIFFSLFFLSWALLQVLALNCRAEEAREQTHQPPANNPSTLFRAISSDPMESPINTVFFQAISSLREKNFVEAVQKLSEVSRLRQVHGYQELPDYSFELIRTARQILADGQEENGLFLLRQAAAFSPSHPRVNLLLASFFSDLGPRRSLRHLWISIGSMWDYPFFSAVFLVNLGLLALVSFTLAFIVLCVVQLIVGGEQVLRGLGRNADKHLQGVLGFILYPLLLVGPLFLGLIPALSLWSISLSLQRRSCRYLVFAAGVLSLGWGYGITHLERIGRNGERPLHAVLENINNGAFTPLGERYLMDELLKDSENSNLLLALAQAFHRRGDEFAAMGLYQKVLENTVESSQLYMTAALNLGTLYYRDRRLEEARQIFEQLERREYHSFELYYDLSLVHLAFLNTDKQREYYEKAREFDRAKADEVLSGASDEARALLGSLEGDVFLPLVLGESTSSALAQSQLEAQRQEKVAKTLGAPNPFFLVVMGFALLLLGVALPVIKPKKSGTKASMRVQNIESTGAMSIVWSALPAGQMIAGKRPISGMFALAVVIALLLAAVDGPVRLFQVLPENVSFAPLLLTVVFSISLLGVALAYWGRERVLVSVD